MDLVSIVAPIAFSLLSAAVIYLMTAARVDERVNTLRREVSELKGETKGLDPKLAERVDHMGSRVAEFGVWINRVKPIEDKLDSMETKLDQLIGRFDQNH